jgi:hypothetical protein
MPNAESPQCTDEDVPDVPDASTMQTGPDALQDWVSILRKCDLLLPIAIGQQSPKYMKPGNFAVVQAGDIRDRTDA